LQAIARFSHWGFFFVCVWLQPSKSQKVPYKILKGMNHLAKFREKVTREKVRAACCTQKGHVEYD